MNVEVRILPEQKVYYAQRAGVDGQDFSQAAQAASGVMWQWIIDHDLHDKISVSLGITRDDPNATPADRTRYEAGFIFDPDPNLPREGDIQIQILPAGRFAVFKHIGPYRALWRTWRMIYGHGLPDSGHEPRDGPPYEVYLDNPDEVVPNKLRTEIFIPIK